MATSCYSRRFLLEDVAFSCPMSLHNLDHLSHYIFSLLCSRLLCEDKSAEYEKAAE